MKIPSILVLLTLATVSATSIQVNAQPAPAASETAAQVEVASVKFNGIRLGQDPWMEVEVEVTAKPGGRAVSGEFIDRVRVSLNLGIELGSEGGVKKRAFYRSSVEAIAIEGGSKSMFRFYLPPEVLKRDKISPNDTGKHYVVELEVGGKPQPQSRGGVSANTIKSEESLRNFLGLVASEGGQNEGVLMPLHLTPFANDSQRRSPTVLRREAQR